ncbi:NRT1/ PTR FAMILY 5.4 [Thalictrum thalictroides]|uniref:NRT1/ PTR FAMILY 5.4 n=1 Tax=Thalictrum thalictroides TaxID=46969 RepID=A0A7J6USD0_THATH|nr:NRT1/ PTR FAMILY 5.4 [Thalictrum thalictroides]
MDSSIISPLVIVQEKDSFKGGWASSVYLIGAEVLERFAMFGATGNLITFLTDILHEPTATAAKNVNIFNGAATLSPILGAFVADTYFGRFKTIFLSSLIYVMGLVMLTLSAWMVPLEFRPVPFFLSLYMIAIGTGGHKPCLQTFGADQFNENNLEEIKAKSTFFNWWYFGICFGASAGMLIIFYVQDYIGWVAGFVISSVAMAVGLGIFLLGKKSYRQHIPSGSPLTRIMQVFVAAICKRHLSVSKDNCTEWYEEGSDEGFRVQPSLQILPRTSHFKCLDKAAIIDDKDKMSVTKNNWRLCTVTQVEEVKLLLRLVPIWLSCLMYAVVNAQGGTFFTKQGHTMDTSIGKSFYVSPASLQVVITLTVLLFVPIYDKIFIPLARRLTGFQSGITMLQRIGFGMFLATIAMIIAALAETTRIRIAIQHGLQDQPNMTVPMSVWWLLPQYVISGVSNVFTVIGLQEFFYDQMPNEIRSVGSAAQFSVFGVGSLLSGVIISIVQYVSSKMGNEWLVDNLNRSHLDYYYWLLAGLGTFGLCAFVGVAKCFVYKKVNAIYPSLE